MRQPLLTLYDTLVVYLGLLLLGVMSLAWTLVATLLYPLLGPALGTALGRYVIMAAFRVYLFSLELSGRCRFDLTELDALRDQPPMIIAPNHPSLLDAVLVISRLPNVACVLKAELMNNLFLGAGARLARYIRNEPIRRMVLDSARACGEGSHLLLFPEGTRTTRTPVNRLKGSVALIAQQAGIPVQTVLLVSNTPYLGKGWSLLRKPVLPVYYKATLGKRFEAPQDTHAFMDELERYYQQALAPALQHEEELVAAMQGGDGELGPQGVNS